MVTVNGKYIYIEGPILFQQFISKYKLYFAVRLWFIKPKIKLPNYAAKLSFGLYSNLDTSVHGDKFMLTASLEQVYAFYIQLQKLINQSDSYATLTIVNNRKNQEVSISCIHKNSHILFKLKQRNLSNNKTNTYEFEIDLIQFHLFVSMISSYIANYPVLVNQFTLISPLLQMLEVYFDKRFENLQLYAKAKQTTVDTNPIIPAISNPVNIEPIIPQNIVNKPEEPEIPQINEIVSPKNSNDVEPEIEPEIPTNLISVNSSSQESNVDSDFDALPLSFQKLIDECESNKEEPQQAPPTFEDQDVSDNLNTLNAEEKQETKDTEDWQEVYSFLESQNVPKLKQDMLAALNIYNTKCLDKFHYEFQFEEYFKPSDILAIIRENNITRLPTIITLPKLDFEKASKILDIIWKNVSTQGYYNISLLSYNLLLPNLDILFQNLEKLTDKQKFALFAVLDTLGYTSNYQAANIIRQAFNEGQIYDELIEELLLDLSKTLTLNFNENILEIIYKYLVEKKPLPSHLIPIFKLHFATKDGV